jgi:hypothetical protein
MAEPEGRLPPPISGADRVVEWFTAGDKPVTSEQQIYFEDGKAMRSQGGSADRWMLGLILGVLTMICWALHDWTGYDIFHAEGHPPLSGLGSLRNGAIAGVAVFFGYGLWPWREP